jgi:hypothetical protein
VAAAAGSVTGEEAQRGSMERLAVAGAARQVVASEVDLPVMAAGLAFLLLGSKRGMGEAEE